MAPSVQKRNCQHCNGFFHPGFFMEGWRGAFGVKM